MKLRRNILDGTIRASMLTLGMVTAVGAAAGQDTRTVTEPVFPASCTVLTSQLGIVGVGPASETTLDTARIQAALNACPSGQAVELAASGSNYAFLTAPINIPSGVSLIVDGGVTLFGSRNLLDYQVGTVSSSQDQCGTQGPHGNGCQNLINFANGGTNVGSGIYGYGVIDGRGYATILNGTTSTGVSWWQNADNIPSGDSQNNPILMKLSKSTNFTLYKITLRNSPMFHVGWSGSGFTAWGVKIQAPFTAHNTDGIDPDGTNITVTNSSISDGDDNVAVGASSAASNVTISYNNTYSGHGISVGSYTQGGLQNMLVTNVNMAGTAADGNATGIRLKSSEDRGGLLNNVTYQNMCLKDMQHILQFTPFYNTNTGTLIPQFTNITLQNLHFLTPTVNTLQYLVALQGHDASHASTITLNNVVFDSLLQANVTSTPPEYETFTLGPGEVYPAFLQSLTGTGVAYVGSAPATNTNAYNCTAASTFPYEVGELYLSTVSATNLKTLSVSAGTSFTLNAMLQPAMATQAYSGSAGSWAGAPLMTQPVQFLEGSTVVGTGSLGANGTLASATLSGVSAGPHTYTAYYPGDTNYAALAFGSVTVTVNAATAASTTTSLQASSTSTTYGTSTMLTATVTTGTGTPTGNVAFMDGTTTLATVTLTGTTAVTTQILGGGTNSVTAVYSGDANHTGSTSSAAVVTVAVATPTATAVAAPTSVVLGASSNVTVTVAKTGSGSYPTGSVNVLEGTNVVGTAALNTAGVAVVTVTPTTVATHTYTSTYVGDANYATASAAAVTVSATIAPTATVVTAPSTSAFNTAVTLTATTSPSGATPSATVPTGSVTFKSGTVTLATVTLTNGVASTSQILNVGANSITAVYSGDTNFSASTSAAAVVTGAQGSTTTALSLSAATINTGASETFTATVGVPTGTAAATGTVTFTNASGTIGTATLNGSGVATLTVTESTAGTQAVTATYGGSTTLTGSASTAATLTVVPVFTMSSAPASIYISAGEQTPVTVTVAPNANATGTVTFSCSSPVAYVTCTMTPASATLVSGAATTTVAQITVAATAGADVRGPLGMRSPVWFAMLLPLGALGLMGRRRGWRMTALASAVLAALLVGMSGCSSSGTSSSSSTNSNLPPVGANTVTVTATAGAVTGSTTITVNVLN